MEKMKIFVSWSGPRSAAVAEALKEYLPMINNAFDPWLSSKDITKGSRSTVEIAQALAAAKAGIICLTPNNLGQPWILFEAGGVAKTVEKPLACTLLIGLEPSDVPKPLGDFQHTRLNEKELLQLVKDLNSAAGENARQPVEVEKAFNLCWPELSQKLEKLPSDGSTQRPERRPEEMLEELVDLSRETSQRVAETSFLMREHFERSASITQTQLDYLTQILARASPPWDAAAGPSRMMTTLSALNGQTPLDRAKDVMFGKAPSPPRGRMAKAFQRAARSAPRNESGKK